MSGKGKAAKIPVAGGGRRKGSGKVSASTKAGLLFPVARTARLLKEGRYARRVGAKAGVFMAAMLEYLTAEVLEAAGSVAREQNRSRINPRHLQLAIRDDDEMSSFMGNVTLPHGGVVPNIHEALLKPNKKGKSKTPSSQRAGQKSVGSKKSSGNSEKKDKEKTTTEKEKEPVGDRSTDEDDD